MMNSTRPWIKNIFFALEGIHLAKEVLQVGNRADIWKIQLTQRGY